MHRPRGCAPLCVILSICIACCSTPPRLEHVVKFREPGSQVSILMMPPDVELEERGLIGSKARLDWGAGARQRTEAIVRDILEAKNITVSVFLATDIPASEAQDAAAAQQRVLFQQLAERRFYPWRSGYAIGAARPSFGSALRDLRQRSDARYALFVALRDRYSSTERVVGQVALGALFVASIVFLGAPLTPLDLDGAGPQYRSHTGLSAVPPARSGSGCPEQIGYASLVDLDTGDIVWLNRVSEGCSDLRDPDDLRSLLELLLSGLS